LRMEATSRANYLANHAETTLANGATVVNGTEYEISFDAKWVSGSPQLRTELYYNDLARLTIVELPAMSGTPGESNSTREVNIGPTYDSLSHFPVVPDASEAVVVSVQADDPDNVAIMTLWYALDGQAWNSVAMNHTGDGVYTGDVPGQGSGAIVQFYVLGSDGLGSTSMFPAAGPDSRALIKFQDGGANAGTQNFRITMLADEVTSMHERVNILSNYRKGGTVVYNEKDVFYDVGVRLRGSMFSRSNSSRAGFNVRFNSDELFRGVHDSVTMKTVSKVEILVKHLAVQAGIPGVNDDMIYLMKPANVANAIAIFSMARHQNSFLDEQFENGSDGMLFKMEGIRVMRLDNGAGPEDLKTYHPNIGWVSSFDLNDFGDDKERYRWNIQIGNNRAQDDYSRIIDMMQTFALTGAALEARAEEVLDVDQWMRTFALMSLAGIGDTYTQGNPHNLNFYVRPSDNKVLALPWDWDFTFSRSTSSPLWGGKNLSNLISRPVNQRLFMGHMLDMINTVYNVDYMDEWTASLGQAAGENYDARLTYIQNRSNFVQSQFIPSVAFSITTNVGADFSTPDSMVTLSGDGWIDVREIRLAGDSNPLAVTWTDENSWEITLPLAAGANSISIEAIGFQGELVGSDAIVVTSTAVAPTLLDSLRITEVMYHPTDATPAELSAGYDADEFEFIEIQNTSGGILNLENVQLTTAVDFTFPDVDLGPGEFILVVENVAAFDLRYGNQLNVVGQWSGGLSNSSDTVRLADPSGVTITEFTYFDSGDWSSRPDGAGSSLEIIDTTGDYTDADNWRPSADFDGSPGTAGTSAQVSIVINEVLTHTDIPFVDSVELFNSTASEIEISGWYLSDANSNYRKYQFPDNTFIAAGEYLVLDESDYNSSAGVDPNDFAFSGVHGDEVYLVETDATDALVRFSDEVGFGAAANGESFGRWPNGVGGLYPMVSQTFGMTNSGPRVGPVIISELMYHPPAQQLPLLADNLEFVEIQNTTGSDVELTDWRIRGGIDFDFAIDEMLAAGDVIVVVPFDPATSPVLDADFRLFYGIDASVDLVGPFTGKLDNGSDRITLQRPDSPPLEEPNFIPRLLEDEVTYDDNAPWVISPDGSGDSLHRVGTSSWGQEATNWFGGDPTPGNGVGDTLQVSSVRWNIGFVDPADLPRGPQPTSWSQQRSDIRNIELVFNGVGDVELEDLRLTSLGINADVDADVPVVLTNDHVSISQNTIQLSFDPYELPSGVYQLSILETATDWNGLPIDGNSNGTPGGDFVYSGNATNTFYVLTAEWSGDAGVSVFDFSTFSYWFGQSDGIAPSYVDTNVDGGVSVFDFTSFSVNFGVGIEYPAGFAAVVLVPSAGRQQQGLNNGNGETVLDRQLGDDLWVHRPESRRLDVQDDFAQPAVDGVELDDLLDVLAEDVAAVFAEF
jgi:hypothetical protein